MPGTGSKMFSMPSPCFAQYFGISCYSDVHCLVTHFTVNWIGPFLILSISLPTCFAVVCQAEGGWAWTQAEQGLPPMVWVRRCGTEFLRGSAGSICCISHFAAQEAAICFLTWLCHHLWNWTTCYKKQTPKMYHSSDTIQIDFLFTWLPKAGIPGQQAALITGWFWEPSPFLVWLCCLSPGPCCHLQLACQVGRENTER